MPIHKKDGATAIVARHWATPVRVIARDASRIGSVVARVMNDPAAGLFRCGGGYTLEWILGVEWFAAGIGYVRDCSRPRNGGSTYARPLRIRPGSKIATPDA